MRAWDNSRTSETVGAITLQANASESLKHYGARCTPMRGVNVLPLPMSSRWPTVACRLLCTSLRTAPLHVPYIWTLSSQGPIKYIMGCYNRGPFAASIERATDCVCPSVARRHIFHFYRRSSTFTCNLVSHLVSQNPISLVYSRIFENAASVMWSMWQTWWAWWAQWM